MALTARKRAFPLMNMPSGSNDQTQQPVGSAFPTTNLYSDNRIWTSSITNPRDRPSAAPKESEASPTGSSLLNADSQANVWSAPPWNNNNNRPSRSVSASPNRARDLALANGAAFFHHSHAHSAIGVKKSSFDSNAFAASLAAAQKHLPHNAALDAITTAFAPSHDPSLPSSHDPSLPPSRQSQNSPHFANLYHTHAHSNSMHSQRRVSSHVPSLSVASSNRPFNYNPKLQEDLPAQFSRRLNLDHLGTSNHFNPPSQPYHSNPASQLPIHSNSASQPWMTDSAMHYAGPTAALDYTPSDPIGSHVSAMKHPSSTDNISSPTPTYRLESGNHSQYNTAIASEAWPDIRLPSRHFRTLDADRRPQSQQHPGLPPSYPHQQSLYPDQYDQYAYNVMTNPYTANLVDAYSQSYRQNLLPNYPISLPSPYGLPNNMQPIRPDRDHDPSRAVRSVLLEEFRQSNKSNKRYELKDIFNHIVEFSGDQHGSRFIQQKLETANSDEKEQVFREIETNATQLMKDVFGNYVVQKFFEHGNQVQKKILAQKMRGKVVDLSIQVYACRVVQKALEHVLVEQQVQLVAELDSEILRVVSDQNGNHVVQKVIEIVPSEHVKFLMNAARGQVPALASHTYGCRVIQRMLEYGAEADKLAILAELHSSAQILITDQYGNYVIQHVIEHSSPADRDKLIGFVMSQLLTLSKHKFASNVVEKCILFGSDDQRTTILHRLTTVGIDGTSPLQLMMCDQYGNYVIQKLLGKLRGTERDTLVREIKPHYFAFRRNGPSRQLQALEKLLGLGISPTTEANGHSTTATPVLTNDHSTMATPALTNETSSPQTSSPPSTHVSAVSLMPADGSQKASEAVSGAVKVRDEEV